MIFCGWTKPIQSPNYGKRTLSMHRLIRIVIKIIISFVILFIGGGAYAIADVAGAGALINLIISLCTIGSLIGVIKYKPKSPDTGLDKTI